MYGISVKGTAVVELVLVSGLVYTELRLPLSSTMIFDTPRAVSVVICIGPRCLVGKPRTRSSEVRSRGGSSPGDL